jgi:hypothetical protein
MERRQYCFMGGLRVIQRQCRLMLVWRRYCRIFVRRMSVFVSRACAERNLLEICTTLDEICNFLAGECAMPNAVFISANDTPLHLLF